MDILDGMVIHVNIGDYYPACRNCAVYKPNSVRYAKLAEENLQRSIESKTGCVLDFRCFDVEKEIVECENFIRSKNPDIKGLFEALSIVPEIENF